MATYESRRYNTPVTDVTKIADGSVNNTEFEHLDGVTSDIQTQLGSKLNLSGGALTGALSTNNDINLGDADSVVFGAGQDMKLFSDGIVGYVYANDLRLQSMTGENYVTAAVNGSANLWYDNANKLQTTANGINVTGTVDGSLFNGNGSNLTSLNASNLSSGTVPVARLPGSLGKVLQVVSTNSTTQFTSNASSLTDITGMSVSITPSASNSKILVMTDFSADTENDNTNYGFQLKRGSTSIGNGVSGNVVSHMNANEFDTMAITFLDSPSTTSATTYKLQFKSFNGGYLSFNRSQSSLTYQTASNITVIEIGA